MSTLSNIRILVARHLDQPKMVRAAVVDFLNILDASLDAEGYEPPPEVVDAIRRLDRACIEADDDAATDISDMEDPEDIAELVDIDDVEDFLQSDDDDDE